MQGAEDCGDVGLTDEFSNHLVGLPGALGDGLGLLGRGHGGQVQQALDACELPVLDVPGILVGEDVPGISIGFRVGRVVGDPGRHVVPSRSGFLDDPALQVDDLLSGGQGPRGIPQLLQLGGQSAQRHGQKRSEAPAEFCGKLPIHLDGFPVNSYGLPQHLHGLRGIPRLHQPGGQTGQPRNQECR